MTFTADKLRAVVNLLSDPLQAHAAAAVLAREAEERKVLVADLIAQTLARSRRRRPRRLGRLDGVTSTLRRIAVPTSSASTPHASAWSAQWLASQRGRGSSRCRPAASSSGCRKAGASFTARTRAGAASSSCRLGWPRASASSLERERYAWSNNFAYRGLSAAPLYSPLGWRFWPQYWRDGDPPDRTCRNFPVQSTAADVMKDRGDSGSRGGDRDQRHRPRRVFDRGRGRRNRSSCRKDVWNNDAGC